MQMQELRSLASRVGCRKSGSKQDLIDRMITHFDGGLDLIDSEGELEAEPEREPKALAEKAFCELFALMSGSELSRILWKLPSLRQSGSKAVKIATLWNCPPQRSRSSGFLVIRHSCGSCVGSNFRARRA